MHTQWMKLAIKEAKKGVAVAPNPQVGAVLVKAGEVIASGYHAYFGGPHAERVAIDKTSGSLEDATLYVTLEPCNHWGKTPPCTSYILKSGVKNVVVGLLDPNPLMRGKSIAFLRENGVTVTTGVCEAEVKALNRAYIEQMQMKVSAKYAMTLDGKIACMSGDSQWISGPESLVFAHELRSCHESILVGVGTVIKDDPQLTVRRLKVDKNPHRFVVDPMGDTPCEAKILSVSEAPTTLLLSKAVPTEKIEQFKALGACVAVIEPFDATTILDTIGQMGYGSLLIEGGAVTHYHFLKTQRVQALYVFIAPKLLVGSGVSPTEGKGPFKMDEAQNWIFETVRTLGDDVLVLGRPKCLQG